MTEQNIQYKCLKYIMQMLQEGNVRGGLRLEQSHDLFQSLTSFQSIQEERDAKEKISKLFTFVEEFQHHGKWTLKESFLLYLCMSSFTNDFPEDILESIVIEKKMI